MIRSRLLPWLALCLWVTLSAPARAESPPLPFMLDDPDGHWRLVPVDRMLATGPHLVAIITPRAGPARLLAFHAPVPKSPAETLAAFATRLRAQLIAEPPLRLVDAPGRRLGYSGHLLRFDSEREGLTFACELFVFATETGRWALLQITSPAAATEPSPFAALQKAAPVPAGAVALAPFRVHENPLTSFPVSLRVMRDPAGDHVQRIYITEVPADSTTERAGVKVGDEVLRINDQPVTAFTGGLGRRSELGQILIDRRPGSMVEFEILTPGAAKSRLVTLIAGQPASALRPW